MRIDALKRLRQALMDREAEIADALRQDLGKCAAESSLLPFGLTNFNSGNFTKH